jgi:hypothetical protein
MCSVVKIWSASRDVSRWCELADVHFVRITPVVEKPFDPEHESCGLWWCPACEAWTRYRAWKHWVERQLTAVPRDGVPVLFC